MLASVSDQETLFESPARGVRDRPAVILDSPSRSAGALKEAEPVMNSAPVRDACGSSIW